MEGKTDIEQVLIELMKACWDQSVTKRPKMTDIHSFLQSKLPQKM